MRAQMTNHQPLLETVTVVVVTFNSAHCLPSLGRCIGLCPNVIVVDNASDDGCRELIKQYLPRAQAINLDKNLGFGAANNRALKHITTPFTLLLNPDCEISLASIEQLIKTAHLWPNAAMVAPQLYGSSQKPEINYRWPNFLWKSKGPGAISGPACVGFLCGAAILLRNKLFENNFFDEGFFLYYEDDDLCARLFKQKKALIIDPAAKAIHQSRGSVRGSHPLRGEYLRGYHHVQSKLIYTKKYFGDFEAMKLVYFLFFTTLLALPLRIILFNPKIFFRMLGRLNGICRWNATKRCDT